MCRFFNRAEIWQALLEKYFPPLVPHFAEEIQSAPKLLFRFKLIEKKLEAQKQLEQRSYRDYGIH
jgi:hypothetical protein